ncbi:Holliday junction resolvase RecU, partial [Streptococcus pneumoniae]
KETKQKRAIPMKNFHPHQIQHMEQVLAQQGICFVLLHFSSQQETYLLPAFDLIRFYHQDKGQKSMPLEYIREYGYEIKAGAFPQIPYLNVIKEHLLGGKTR